MGSHSFTISGVEHRTVEVPRVSSRDFSVSYSYNFVNSQNISVDSYSIISITYRRTVHITSNNWAAGSDPITVTIPRTSGNDNFVKSFTIGVGTGSAANINESIQNPLFENNALTVSTHYRNNWAGLGGAKTFNTTADSISGNYWVPDYTITITSGNDSFGTVQGYNPAQNIYFTESNDIEYLITGVILTATPKRGYKFKNWTITGTNTEVSTSASYELPGITAEASYTANFEPITYTLKYNANGGSGVMPSVNLKYTDDYILLNSSFDGPKAPVAFDGNGATQSYNQIKYYSKLFDNTWQYTDSEGNSYYYAPGDNIANTFLVADGSTVELQAIWNNNIIINDFETPFRQHHLFKGWLRNDGELYFENSQPIIVDCTRFNNFIAQWEKYQFRAFLITDDSEHYKRIPYLFLKDKKIKRLIIYTPELGYKEI